MRRLTITREKSFVGSMGKLKIYIEDAAGDMNIQGVNCRRLGELKNGQTGEFIVGDEPAKVYVIADNLSKNYCCDFYQLPAGDQDVALSGVCKFNPGTGNAFRFNGNEDNQEAMAQRAKGRKKGWLICILALLGGVVIGLGLSLGACGIIRTLNKASDKPKTFSTSDGNMSIVLSREFKKDTDKENEFSLSVFSKNAAVIVQKQPFSDAAELKTMSIDQFAKLVAISNGRSSATIKRDGAPCYFEYDFIDPDNGNKLHYWVYSYKGSDAFWLVNFSCFKDDEAAVAPHISEWAKSVTVK